MKFKRSTKKESPKKKTVSEVKVTQDTLSKEEIKDLVEETVDEVLKGQDENESKVAVEKEITSAKVVESSQETTNDDNMSLDKQPQPETSDKSDNKPSKPDEQVKESEETKETSMSSVSLDATSAIDVSSSTTGENNVEVSSSGESAENTKIGGTSATPVTPVISVSGVTSNTNGSVLSEDKNENKKSPLIMLFIVFVICGFVIGISILYLLSKNNFKFPDVSSVTSVFKKAPTPTVVVVTPTPATVDVAKYKINVLNGSGVAGAAARAKDDLTSAGFTVSSTGNADNSTTDTTIAAKSTVDANTLNKLAQTLSSKYTVSSQTLSLGVSDTADIVVTIGAAK